ncbi:MAG: ATP-binding cassette domain-containing protein, partial [Hydrogenoanaerobacterium sp.]
PNATVLQNVQLPLQYTSLAKKEHEATAMAVLESLEIAQLANKYPTALSGGEQQRVAIARAIVNSPEVLLADEPTGNLDADTGKLIMKTLTRLHADNGKTIVLVTHDVKIASYADKIIEMRGGVIANYIYKNGGGVC